MHQYLKRSLLLIVVWTLFVSDAVRVFGQRGQVEFHVVDKDSGQAVAARMHLKDQRGKPVIPRGFPSWKDHFVFEGNVTLKLPAGVYTFELERGPEYRVRSGNFTMQRGVDEHKELIMHRFVDMKREGWWSGELHVHRPLEDIELLMRAEDLHVAPVITWWNKRNPWDGAALPEKLLVQFDGNRFYHVMAGEDERGGGALLYFNLNRPLPIAGAAREYPSPVTYLIQARQEPAVHVDIEKPFWWDMPVWVASGKIDSIGLAHNHMWRDGVLANEAWGRPRDAASYPNPYGNGRWSQDIYYHLLNCGLRVPPSAGSASGVLANPVGYNRVYVHCGDELTYEKWWEGLRAGRVVVTNGPLLRPKVNGQLPGYVFEGAAGTTFELHIDLQLSLRDKVDYLEVVQNGRVVHEIRLDKFARDQGRLPPVVFQESGWMLIRAVSNNPRTYRFGSTGPYYVEIGSEPRISRKSAQFFLDWVNQRAQQIQLDDAAQQKEVLAFHEAARRFWQQRVAMANCD